MAGDVARSGVMGPIETLGFLPLLGYEWLVAALPALLVYGVSNGGRGGLAQLSIYYSGAVLPLLFIAAACALTRIGAWRVWGRGRQHVVRLGSIALLVLCSLDGASYVFFSPKPSRLDIASLILPAGGRVLVQGALLPHMPLEAPVVPLTSLAIKKSPREVVILDLTANPYPFSAQELQDYARRLALSGFVVTRMPHGLLLASSEGGEAETARPAAR